MNRSNQNRSYRPTIRVMDAIAYGRRDMDHVANEILVTEGIRPYQTTHIQH